MTEKELRKLKKQDYLQLLVAQGQEMAELQAQLSETTTEIDETQSANVRLKSKLDEKDELIEKLKDRLDEKDALIARLRQELDSHRESRRIELDAAGSIAMASLQLNGIFEAAQQAADQYLYNIKLMCNDPEALKEEEALGLGVDVSELDGEPPEDLSEEELAAALSAGKSNKLKATALKWKSGFADKISQIGQKKSNKA